MNTAQKSKNQKRNPRRRGGRKGPSRRENMEVQAVYNAIVAKKSNPGNRPQKKRGRGRRGQRGGMRTRNLPVANNQREFVVPIDEQIQLVNGVTGYGQLPFSINPGNPLLFPFISRTAQNYERYEFEDLEFHYKPSAGVFATVGAQGFVGISATDDALQAPPSTQQIAEVLLHSPIVETAVPCRLMLNKRFMESSRKQKHFVRPNGLIPGGADAHLYDCAQVFFWASGQANTNQIGEFRVTGKVRLSNPVLELSTLPAPQFMTTAFQSNAVAMGATTVPFNLALATVGTTNNPLNIVNNAGVFTPPVGNYNVQLTEWYTLGTALVSNQTVLQKNGVNVAVLESQEVIAATAVKSTASASFAGFVTANGTDTFNVLQTTSYTGAAGTYTADLTWTAI